MKRVSLLLAALLVVVLTAFALRPGAASTDMGPLSIGDAAPLTEVVMTTTADETTSLADVAGENGLLVMFSCNTCPYVLAWEDRFNEIAARAEELGIGFIAVNPNEGARSGVDSMAEMKKRAAEAGYTFPYAVDENHQLADAFGATRTPEMFLFGGDMVLRYHGAIDDNAQNENAVKDRYLFDAMAAMAAGETIDPATTRSTGCGIKRL